MRFCKLKYFLIYALLCFKLCFTEDIIKHEEGIIYETFIIEQAEACNEEKALVDYLEKENVIKAEDKRRILNTLSREINHKTRRRLLDTVKDNDFIKVEELKVNRLRKLSNAPLSKLPMEQRRDEAITVLDILVSLKQKELLSTTSDEELKKKYSRRLLTAATSSSKEYLSELKMDIIDNELLPNDQVYELAKHLPCLAYPPARDAVLYPTGYEEVNDNFMESDIVDVTTTALALQKRAQGDSTEDCPSPVYPNDYYADPRSPDGQWYLESPTKNDGSPTGIYGASLYKAWGRYRGIKADLVIGVVDTGCSMHPDLQENLCQSDLFCEGKDFTEKPLPHPFRERKIHGTPMAGVIAASTNNKHDCAGICWGCTLMCLNVEKYTPEKENSQIDLNASIEAIDYMRKKHIKLSNHSYASSSFSDSQNSAMIRLMEDKHIVVTGAGNEGCDVDHLGEKGCKTADGRYRRRVYPAAYMHENIVSVGGTSVNGERYPRSNWGEDTIDIFAPGEGLRVLTNTYLQNRSTNVFTGTSLSAAIVTGVIGLVWASNPDLSYIDVIDVIYSSVYPVHSLLNSCISGGIIDAEHALILAKGYTDTGIPYVNKADYIDRTAEFYRDDEPTPISNSALKKILMFQSLLVIFLMILLA